MRILKHLDLRILFGATAAGKPAGYRVQYFVLASDPTGMPRFTHEIAPKIYWGPIQETPEQ